ncbi:MAG: DUF4831 family protein [Mangrovibacterium sp.]|nr:DUF4831 family protein [Mangrovibacterium sp.]
MKTGYIVGLIFMILGGSAVAQRTEKKEGVPAFTNGVVYSLPRTGIRIYVTATREKFFFGPYHDYAEVLLGIKNAPSSDRETWTINDIRVETFSEPDPGQVHRTSGQAAALISLTPSGTLAGINATVETPEERFPVATFLGDTKAPSIPFTDLSLNSFFEKVDSANRNALVIKSFEEKVQEAAHTITKLRKRRFKTLANGYDEQLPDGRAYEVMVEELDKLEKEYVALFIGKTYKKTFEYCFDYIPENNPGAGEVVFRFSEGKGVLPVSDMSGKPIVIEMKKMDNLASAQAKVASASPSVSGILYRVPGKSEIRILNGITLMAATRADIAQFGTTTYLPDELLDGNYRVTFHPATGGIKSILQK